MIEIKNIQIFLTNGDITDLDVDAIVNAANTQLILGAGVAGAIRRKGGISIQEECDLIGGTPVGTAVITGAGRLKAKHVIHAVGPVMGEGNEDEKLKSATFNSLRVAGWNGIKTIAFPAISTGIFGYPLDRCADIMLNVAFKWANNTSSIEKIIFCLYDEKAYCTFLKKLHELNSEIMK